MTTKKADVVFRCRNKCGALFAKQHTEFFDSWANPKPALAETGRVYCTDCKEEVVLKKGE